MYLQLIQNICQKHNHYLAMLVNLYLHVIQERQIQINQKKNVFNLEFESYNSVILINKE